MQEQEEDRCIYDGVDIPQYVVSFILGGKHSSLFFFVLVRLICQILVLHFDAIVIHDGCNYDTEVLTKKFPNTFSADQEVLILRRRLSVRKS